MDYAAALAYLQSFINLERHAPGPSVKAVITLDRVRELAARLGNPQDAFPSLHVAGTKGKGSTCAFAQSLLTAAGLKAGLYTSPHLQDVRERIRIGSELVPEADFARLLAQCVPALEAMRVPPPGQRRPTYFEVLTHLAFSWFAECRVDVAVVEVGIGGRLDATNIVTPVACGITGISLDHQAILGDTLPLIAREKAGIIKPGVPVVIAPQVPEVVAVFEECARLSRAPCEFVGREIAVTSVPPAGPRQGGVEVIQLAVRGGSGRAEVTRPLPNGAQWPLPRARLELPDGVSFDADLGLRGSHQVENWAVAVRLADLFWRKKTGAHIPARAVQAGSRDVCWPGRLEYVGAHLILDGAHNDHSLRIVLREMAPYVKPTAILFACAKDKNVAAMLQVLAESAVQTVVFTHSGNPRGKDPHELAALWRTQTGREAPAYPSCAKGLAVAKRLARPDGILLVTGSLYLVGAVKDLLAKRTT